MPSGCYTSTKRAPKKNLYEPTVVRFFVDKNSYKLKQVSKIWKKQKNIDIEKNTLSKNRHNNNEIVYI